MDHHLFAARLKDLTLLYIEDDPQIQSHLAEFLGRYTSGRHLASSAEEGLERYEALHPHIILLDINLPGMSGIDFAKEVRRREKQTRIVISTAYTDKEFLLSAVELELTRYLVKPVTSQDLAEALSKAADELEARAGRQVDLGEGYRYDLEKKMLLHGDSEVALRRKEMALLEYFIENAHRTLTYEMLQYDVWQESPMSRDAIRAQIRNIRKKSHPGIIYNINAIGYRLYKGDR
jgi:two-component system response regulator VanR